MQRNYHQRTPSLGNSSLTSSFGSTQSSNDGLFDSFQMSGPSSMSPKFENPAMPSARHPMLPNLMCSAYDMADPCSDTVPNTPEPWPTEMPVYHVPEENACWPGYIASMYEVEGKAPSVQIQQLPASQYEAATFDPFLPATRCSAPTNNVMHNGNAWPKPQMAGKYARVDNPLSHGNAMMQPFHGRRYSPFQGIMDTASQVPKMLRRGVKPARGLRVQSGCRTPHPGHSHFIPGNQTSVRSYHGLPIMEQQPEPQWMYPERMPDADPPADSLPSSVVRGFTGTCSGVGKFSRHDCL